MAYQCARCRTKYKRGYKCPKCGAEAAYIVNDASKEADR